MRLAPVSLPIFLSGSFEEAVATYVVHLHLPPNSADPQSLCLPAACSMLSKEVRCWDAHELLAGHMWFQKSDIIGAGVNGAGKTTQLQIITGALQPDSGAVVKEKPNMRIAYLTQEFDVEPTRTVRVCTLRFHFALLDCFF